MTLDLDALEAVARAAAEPAPETFSAAAFGAWVLAGREYQKATQPEVALALLTRLREAEACIHDIDGEVQNFEQSDNDALCAIEHRLSRYKPTNQENGEGIGRAWIELARIEADIEIAKIAASASAEVRSTDTPEGAPND